jgi:Fe-S-cluster containining protein
MIIMTRAQMIRVHSAQPLLDVPPSQVYFPFGSGRLGYDCVGCKATCCKGHGYGIQAGHELQAQLQTSPSVRFFLEDVSLSHGRNYTMRNCAPGCFFLTTDGRCGIQAQHGYEAKPETCRLFPFNNIRLVGKYLIAAPHTGLCPLAVLPPSTRSALSEHEALIDAMRLSGIGARIPSASTDITDIDTLVHFERQVVELAEAHLTDSDFLSFAISQIELTDRTWGQSDHRAARQRLVAYAALLDEIMSGQNVQASSPDPELDRTLIALTPFVRSMLVFRSADDTAPIALDRVPYALVALRALTLHARAAGMPAITFQSLMHIFQPNRPLLALLAHTDCEVRWRPDASIELPLRDGSPYRRAYLRIVRALLHGSRDRTPGTLGQILCKHLDSDGIERAMTLKALARQLAGRCVEAGQGPATARRRGFRVAVQQWVIGRFSENALLMMAELEFDKKRPALSGAGPR